MYKRKFKNINLLLLNWLIIISIIFECSQTVVSSSSQYHIQTDEGPERYFRFKTDNGQFRKEKRLQDGTVIGTEAWIDAAGFLREKSYIADKDGYRILKSKVVYVGHDHQRQDPYVPTKPTLIKPNVYVDINRNTNDLYSNKVADFYHTTTLRPTYLLSTPSYFGFPQTNHVHRFSSPHQVDYTNLLDNSLKATIAPPIYNNYNVEAENDLNFLGHSTPKPFLHQPFYSTPSPIIKAHDFGVSTTETPLFGARYNVSSDNYVTPARPRIPESFQYLLPPHQYNDDNILRNEQPVVTYGYVDPFGIRRVVRVVNPTTERDFSYRTADGSYLRKNSLPYD